MTTRIDPNTGAMLASNPWNPAFGQRVAFADMAGRQTSLTGDRSEFIGRNGALSMPAAMVRDAPPLSGRTGSGLDPCAAMRTRVVLGANGSVEIVFFLGDAETEAEAHSLILEYRRTDLDEVLERGPGVLGRDHRRDPGEDAGPVDGHHAQRLAAVSDAGLPRLGPLGLLPGQRRLRLPRPAAGLHGAYRRAART